MGTDGTWGNPAETPELGGPMNLQELRKTDNRQNEWNEERIRRLENKPDFVQTPVDTSQFATIEFVESLVRRNKPIPDQKTVFGIQQVNGLRLSSSPAAKASDAAYKFGKVVTSWTYNQAQPNRIVLRPCTSDGTAIASDDSLDETIYIFWPIPTSIGDAAFLVADLVIPYLRWPLKDANGCVGILPPGMPLTPYFPDHIVRRAGDGSVHCAGGKVLAGVNTISVSASSISSISASGWIYLRIYYNGGYQSAYIHSSSDQAYSQTYTPVSTAYYAVFEPIAYVTYGSKIIGISQEQGRKPIRLTQVVV